MRIRSRLSIRNRIQTKRWLFIAYRWRSFTRSNLIGFNHVFMRRTTFENSIHLFRIGIFWNYLESTTLFTIDRLIIINVQACFNHVFNFLLLDSRLFLGIFHILLWASRIVAKIQHPFQMNMWRRAQFTGNSQKRSCFEHAEISWSQPGRERDDIKWTTWTSIYFENFPWLVFFLQKLFGIDLQRVIKFFAYYEIHKKNILVQSYLLAFFYCLYCS